MSALLLGHVPAFIVAFIAVARATRLLTFDDFPPTKKIREWYVTHAGETWGPLFLCPFCMAPYLAALDIAWYLVSYYQSDPSLAVWWVVNLWAAVSYLAAIVVAYDQPEE